MADENHSRVGGNRPRTHPIPDKMLGAELRDDILRRLVAALAAANVAIAALQAQAADIDNDAALLLRTCVADEIDRLIDRLEKLVARGDA
jgi:hypothetical protein